MYVCMLEEFQGLSIKGQRIFPTNVVIVFNVRIDIIYFYLLDIYYVKASVYICISVFHF